MLILTIQIHDSTEGWIDAAELRFQAHAKVEIEYDIDYATMFLGSVDHRALSVNYPVSLDPFRGDIPGYLIDLIPQGQVLKRLLNLNGIKKDTNYEEILSRIPLASPGNIRIKESWSKIEVERPGYQHSGFNRADLLAANTNFLKYMEEHGAPIGGTSGAVGGAPKFLLREDRLGNFHADGYLDDSATKRAWLIKFPFTDSSNSKLLLRTEKSYYDILIELGFYTGDPLEWQNDMLFIPRFDRIRAQDGRLHYYGLESFYSAHNMNTHGLSLTHESNILLIDRKSDDSKQDIVEYLKRDLVNQALANTDNHGRNSSFIKFEDSVKLSPIYDVTAMRLFEGDFIVPLTRWEAQHSDLASRCDWISRHTKVSGAKLRNALKDFHELIEPLENLMIKFDVPKEIIKNTKADRAQCLTELKTYLRSP